MKQVSTKNNPENKHDNPTQKAASFQQGTPIMAKNGFITVVGKIFEISGHDAVVNAGGANLVKNCQLITGEETKTEQHVEHRKVKSCRARQKSQQDNTK